MECALLVAVLHVLDDEDKVPAPLWECPGGLDADDGGRGGVSRIRRHNQRRLPVRACNTCYAKASLAFGIRITRANCVPYRIL